MQSDKDNDVGSENDKERENDKEDVVELIAGSNISNENCENAFELAPFNPSSKQIQKKGLEMLDLCNTDVLFDLGCGDGRFLINAATQTPGLRCVGIDIQAEYVCRGRDNVRELQMEDRIDIRRGDATKAAEYRIKDEESEVSTSKPVQQLTLLDDATVLYLFILPKGIVKMMPVLNALKQKRLADGKRLKVLSYMFGIHDWEPTVYDETARGGCPIYYYEIGGPN